MRTRRTGPASSRGTALAAIALASVLLPVLAPGIARAVGEPVDVFFVLDNSGSMRTNDPDRAMRGLVVEFASSMSPGSRLGVVVFDESARVVEPLSAKVGPASGARWNDVMANVDYAGRWTNSAAGIERALYEFKQSGRDGVAKAVKRFMTHRAASLAAAKEEAEAEAAAAAAAAAMEETAPEAGGD